MASTTHRTSITERKPPLGDIFSQNMLALVTLATLASTVVVVYAPMYIERHFEACHSPKCMNLNTDLRLMMESEADPCQDFFHYACANFKSIYPRSSSYMEAFTKRVKRSFREMINQFVIESPVAIQHYPLESYRKCIDDYVSESYNLGTILNNDNELARLWFSIRDRNIMDGMLEFLMGLSLDRGTPVFIGTGVVRNSYTKHRNMLRIKLERVKPPPKRRIVQNIIQYFSRTSSWDKALKLSKAIVATMEGVTKALRHPSLHEKLPQVLNYYDGSQILHVQYYRFAEIMKRFPLDENEWIPYFFTTDALALRSLTRYLSNVDPDTFSYTVRFIIAESLLTTASYAFVDIYDMPPAAASRSRMVACANLSLMLLPTMTEYHFFQEWLGQEKSTPPPSLFDLLPEKFSLVDPFSRMRERTKANLVSTLRNITVVPGHDAGYNSMEDISKITAFKGLGIDFTSWVLNALKSKAQFRANLLIGAPKKLPANDHILDLNPGATYDASEDVLRVLPSLLLPPFDLTAKPSAFTFGHLGSYVAEAFAQAALPESLSGHLSRMRYPTQADRDAFLEELDCIGGERTRTDKVLLDFETSLNLLTSVIGVKVAHKAWEDWKDRGTAEFVPYVKTDEQAFFIGFCLRHCGVANDSHYSDLESPRENSSLPRAELCNLPLRHTLEFASAFSCNVNSSMAPENKCA
ncbi:neprilysin-11-like [Dermacentor variabilis]|uniref:neprilysin-11-like n=1 Tax=Dermacentor variabilis TaxID=34621 RepID=UPI003F5C0C96